MLRGVDEDVSDALWLLNVALGPERRRQVVLLSEHRCQTDGLTGTLAQQEVSVSFNLTVRHALTFSLSACIPRERNKGQRSTHTHTP